MKRELGIAKCGLACCLCSENTSCNGCQSEECQDKEWCENRKCSIEKGISNCFLCENQCRKGMLSKMKPYGFTMFAKQFGLEALLDFLEQNEKKGVVYHREGIHGDYDDFGGLYHAGDGIYGDGGRLYPGKGAPQSPGKDKNDLI